MPPVKLSTLALVLGAIISALGAYGIANPRSLGDALRKFPRSLPWGFALTLVATVWFVLNVRQESIADFEPMKPYLYALFIAVGVGTCIYVQDFLAVRGLAVVLMLVAKLMVDTGRPHLGQTSWVLVNQSLAYVWVFFGIWLTVAPWRLRDWIQTGTASESRLRIPAAASLALGLLMVVLGVTAFRG